MMRFFTKSSLNKIKIKPTTLIDLFMSIFKGLFLNSNQKNADINPNIESKPTNVSTNELHFDFLDGFRGLCAFSIIVVHSIGGPSEKDIYKNTLMRQMHINGGFVQSIAIPGFFLLSSFLLTYRLMSELLVDAIEKYDSFKIITKYFIRRFFRIYIPFVIYCTGIKYSPSHLGADHFYAEWYKLVTLRFNMGDFNHLWTIPIEINYYFFIPIICILYLGLYRANKRVLYSILIICICLAPYHLKHNLFFKFPRNPFVVNMGDFRAPTFSTFLCGSLLAFTFLSYENEISRKKICQKIIASKFVQILLNLLTTSMIIYSFRSEYLRDNNGGEGNYYYWYKGGLFWAVAIFLLLLSSNEYSYGRMFFNIKLLKKFGIYSYGIYLLHPAAIRLAERIKSEYKLINFKNSYEFFALIAFLSFSIGFLFYVLIERNMITIATYLCKSSYLKTSRQKKIKVLPLQGDTKQ
jgi:peptidoglycan/LPS O-acetylase OafA/YrhL